VEPPIIRPAITCRSGLVLSIQASRIHYSSPRSDTGPYTHVEVRAPDIPALREYREAGVSDGLFLYAFVPVGVVEALVDGEGGAVEGTPWVQRGLPRRYPPAAG
jgi:hypothetical protein